MATAAAAVVARARRQVENLFFDNEAFSPERAVEFNLRMPVQQRFLDQLIAERIVHEASPGRYWLDLDEYKENRRRRAVWTAWILALSVVVVGVVWLVRRLT